MKCLAIDDEPLALNIIKDFCSKIDFMDLISCCTNPVEAVKVLNHQEVDLIFLDIQMPNITGLEFIKAIDKPPMIIFTTAYSNYALDGFELNAIDYLVKPFAFERFFRAVNKAYEMFYLRKNKNIQPATTVSHQNTQRYLMIKVEYSTVKLELDRILFIEGLKDYVKIYCGIRPVLTKTTLKNLEEKLPQNEFIRVHKSYIVQFSKINSIENNRILIGEKRIPIGNQYKTQFYNMVDSKRI
ncbi:MAG: response regulator transcription factor [Bacteroidales bacterium]|nr:response regulator transcription factor [Bacteroidales bacterium]